MELRHRLEELHLALEGAVDQLTRAQRLTTGADAPAELAGEMDRALAEVVALRNRVREQLMRVLATAPKKLPVL
jgi:hypothetical protein